MPESNQKPIQSSGVSTGLTSADVAEPDLERMLRDRVDLPFRIAIEAIKFVPEYTQWWTGLDTLLVTGEELGHLLNRWRDGQLASEHPIRAEFDRMARLIPALAMIGPVDPRPEVNDHPIDRFWAPRPWEDLATGERIDAGMLEEAAGAFGILPQTRSVQLSEDPEVPSPRGRISVYLDLTSPPTDLDRAILLLRRRYGITERRTPPTGRTWDDPAGGLAAAFEIFRLAVADESRLVSFVRLAERAGIVDSTSPLAERAAKRAKAGGRARKMAYEVQGKVQRLREDIRLLLPPSTAETPTCARKPGTRRRPDGPRGDRTMRIGSI